MYVVNAVIRGTSALLQHAFGAVGIEDISGGNAKKQTGVLDYSLEWLGTMYTTPNGYLCQPASHIEAAMQRAGTAFKPRGQRGKTFKDIVKAYAYVSPDMIIHYRDGQPVLTPDESLLRNPQNGLSVSIMRVKVQRAAVARARLMIDPGWQLAFQIQVIDDQLNADSLRDILVEAGRANGIGDFRPRYGRFEVTDYEVVGNGRTPKEYPAAAEYETA